MKRRRIQSLVVAVSAALSQGFVSSVRNTARQPSSRNAVVHWDPTIAAIVAGSIAGAVGVGVAFPLDTIKTKQQFLSNKYDDHTDLSARNTPVQIMNNGGAAISAVPQSPPSMKEVARQIYETQGIPGFFGGVQTSMMGQAVIKSVAFGVNTFFLTQLHNENVWTAAAMAGLVTAFLAVPCDRIKVLVQTQEKQITSQSTNDEWACFQEVLQKEGFQGLCLTGLGPTLLREVPAYTLYFGAYGWFMTLVHNSLVSGALAGAICVVPSYPADVVKTLVQSATESEDTWELVQDLADRKGLAAFWDGLTPRMLRASLNHAVTFVLFDALQQQMV